MRKYKICVCLKENSIEQMMLIIFFSSYQKCVDELYKVNCPQKTSLTRAVIFFAAVYLFKIYLLLCLAFIWWTIVPEIWRTSTCSFQLLHAARGMSLCTKLFHYFLISLSCFSNIFSKHCYRFHYLHFRLCGRKKKRGGKLQGASPSLHGPINNVTPCSLSD